jgi:methylmalonyl-CoA mutase N-terminal domain/subunit
MATDKKIFTDSGIEIKTIYTQDDLALIPPSGVGGTFPFTRGVQPDMYRGKMWTMRQYAGFSTAEESNQRYHYLLSQGVNGLSVAFDLPTQIGYDSDHPLADGEVGKVGVAIDSLEDMEILFKGINLDEITSSMTINASGFILLAFYIALAKKQGADLKKISGTIQNDILKEYAARGTFQAIIFVRPAAQPCRKLLLHSAMAKPMCRLLCKKDWTLMFLVNASPSSLTHTIICLKKWPSSVQPGVCGPA